MQLDRRSTLPAFSDLFTPDAFEEVLKHQLAQLEHGLRSAYERPSAALDAFEDDADDLIEMSPEEYDRYLDEWSTNMPPNIFEQLVARRTAQLKQQLDAAQAEGARRYAIYIEAVVAWEPMRRKGDPEDAHLAKLWAWFADYGWTIDAAEDAYLNR